MSKGFVFLFKSHNKNTNETETLFDFEVEMDRLGNFNFVSKVKNISSLG